MFPNYKRTNPPLWLERNLLFRKLYILRRLIHSTKHRYFSDTDKYIGSLLEYLATANVVSEPGFFVDVGCFHPIRGNTTYALYKKGWRGINIDADQIKIELFRLRRPRDTHVTCAISKQTGTAEYWRKGLWSGLNSLEKLEREQSEEGWRKMRVSTDTLTKVIDQTDYKGRPIDFLSVDVEGHNLSVLQALDFERYHPKVICVETWESTIEDVMQSALYAFMIDQGYVLVNWINLNLIFLHRDYPSLYISGICSRDQ